MALERTGIVEEGQRRIKLYGDYRYQAPVFVPPPAPEPVLETPIAPHPTPVSRPPLPRPPRRQTNHSARIERKINEIIYACATAFDVSVGDLLSRSKPNWIAHPRFAIVRLLRANLRLSFPAIGHILDRDHTSTLVAFRRCRELRRDSLRYRHRYTLATRMVRGIETPQ